MSSPETRSSLRRLAPAVLAVPVLMLLTGSFLPWVNRGALWLGLPPLVVWSSLGVLALTPCFLLVERAWHGPLRDDGTDDNRDRR